MSDDMTALVDRIHRARSRFRMEHPYEPNCVVLCERDALAIESDQNILWRTKVVPKGVPIGTGPTVFGMRLISSDSLRSGHVRVFRSGHDPIVEIGPNPHAALRSKDER